MLTPISKTAAGILLDHDKMNIISAIKDIFYSECKVEYHRNQKDKLTKTRSLSQWPLSLLHNSDADMDYELLDVVPVSSNLAVVKILRTPLDKAGKKMPKGASSPLLVIAKSGDEWEMVGLPLPRDCLPPHQSR